MPERKLPELWYFCHCEGGTTEAISSENKEIASSFVPRSSQRQLAAMGFRSSTKYFILTKLRDDDNLNQNCALSKHLKKRGFYELNAKTPFLTKRGGVFCCLCVSPAALRMVTSLLLNMS